MQPLPRPTDTDAAEAKSHREGRTIEEYRGMLAPSGDGGGGKQDRSDLTVEPGSYRDRNGAVFYRDSSVLRGISAKALQNWERLSGCQFFRGIGSQRERSSERSVRRILRRKVPGTGPPSWSINEFLSYPTPTNGRSEC
jgi:hypothetical protein